MTRMLTLVLLMVITLSACGERNAGMQSTGTEQGTATERTESVAIDYANQVSDKVIDLDLSASSASELATEVDEGDDSVTVSVVRTNPPEHGEPARTDRTSVTIELDEPLGERTLIDASTGEEVPFRSADAPS